MRITTQWWNMLFDSSANHFHYGLVLAMISVLLWASPIPDDDDDDDDDDNVDQHVHWFVNSDLGNDRLVD